MDARSKDELLGLLRTAKACRERDWLMILGAIAVGRKEAEALVW